MKRNGSHSLSLRDAKSILQGRGSD